MSPRKAPIVSRTILTHSDPKRYEIETLLKETKVNTGGADTQADLIRMLEKGEAEVDALTLCAGPKGYAYKRLNREQFLEAWKKPKDAGKILREVSKLKEDAFATGSDLDSGVGSNLVGQDYVPLLGGPFNKQLYYADQLKNFALAYQTYNHDPIAHALVEITVAFVLGRGLRVDAKCKDKDKRALAQAWWDAFAEVNQFDVLIEQICRESDYYGEAMLYKVPNNAQYISYNVKPGQEPEQGVIPRIRQMDPSACWEIVTYPEDISRVLFYKFIYPTQYQLYTGKDKGEDVPSSKFIMQDIPASQMRHYKINAASNEKRGRSDLFSAFGFLKRLRDVVEYGVVAAQKAGAWSIDTTIEGSPTDIANYISDQESQGTIAPAGSEFVHSSKIKRDYRGNTNLASGSDNPAFLWCLNMACASKQIPVTYLGTHISGGSTRAGALVGTEPVAKKIQIRQKFIERIVKDMAKDVMQAADLQGVEWEVTFPEILTQDRSAKIKDIKINEDCGYFSRKRAAEMSAKEMDVSDYEYETERLQIEREQNPPAMPTTIAPLTAPAQATPSPAGTGGDSSKPGAVTSDERRSISMAAKN